MALKNYSVVAKVLKLKVKIPTFEEVREKNL